MLLQFSGGEPFATGAIHYDYRPATENETTNRMMMQVAVENILAEAVVDTGAPYPVIAPRVARQVGLDRVTPLEREVMLIRGIRMEGGIIRLSMTLPADIGDDLTVDATAFIPDRFGILGQLSLLYRPNWLSGKNPLRRRSGYRYFLFRTAVLIGGVLHLGRSIQNIKF